jgi:hypothetical protein
MAPANARTGDNWDIDAALAKKILLNFYPPTGNTDLSTNTIKRMSLRGVLVSDENGKARVRLFGALRMHHPFFTTGDTASGEIQAKDDSYDVVVNQIAGYVDYDKASRQVKSLRMIGEDATYDGSSFVIAVCSHNAKP